MKTIKGILATAMLCVATTSFAQVYNTVNSPSRSAINSKESLAGVVGEPYLYKEFKRAHVRFANATTSLYEIKYDQLADEVIVKTEGGQELAFSDPVLEFKFQESKKLFRSGFASTSPKTTEKSFYEVIFDGKVKYIKRAAKILIELEAVQWTGYQKSRGRLCVFYRFYQVPNLSRLKTKRLS